MFNELKEYAKKNNVPIIKDDSLDVLLSLIKDNNVKSILELGTAIGYSSLSMASLNIPITTIERNEIMYNEAIKNITKYGFSDLVEVVFMDALEYTPNKSYDLIFIDAAKAQNIKFVERFTPFLNKGGLIVIDNINFHGLKSTDTGISKNLRSMLKKIEAFKEYIMNNPLFDTYFLNVGDGLSISRLK